MTDHYKEIKTVEEVVKHKRINTTCDWCKETIEKDYYDVLTTNIELEYNGTSYGQDGGNYQKTTVEDLCEECTIKLIQVIKAMGINVKEEEVNW